MIHLRIRTEYSFRRAFGSLERVMSRVDGPAFAITDGGCWGHVPFYKAMTKAKRTPIFGVEIPVVQDAQSRTKQQIVRMAFLAKSPEGLRELYQLVSLSNRQMYYVNRIDYADLKRISDQLIILSGTEADLSRYPRTPTAYLEMNPGSTIWNRKVMKESWWNKVVCADNLYPTPADRRAYEVMMQAPGIARRVAILHIPNEDEMRIAVPEADDEAFLNTERIAAEIGIVGLPEAEMVKPVRHQSLRDMCAAGYAKRHLDPEDSVYADRLTRELDMIADKHFEDYFYVIAEMVNRAKSEMLVGPGRGSSSGSLVCFLLGITDVDPIIHGLMFERFIDVTRADLPDIDLDFPDETRDRVIEQLRETYGAARVGRLGTVSRYKAKSALGEVAGALRIPFHEMTDLKGAMIERSSGDARAQFCISDAFETLDVGKSMVLKYPGLRIAAALEGHARHSGMHAAGVVVSQQPVSDYCAIDASGAAQIDKVDAEELNALKIDCLGLRTLSVLQDCLASIGKSREWILSIPLDDAASFKVINDDRMAGIFQFEGYALKTLTRQMGVKEFYDIVAITSLARPGPLHGGGADEFVARRIGREPVMHMHPMVEDITRETYGTVIYQEQVMAVGRRMGNLTWEDVSSLRKAMSKSLGEEFFNKYWEIFKQGAGAQGVSEVEARKCWDKMCTFGSWAFNKSHAVAYGMISYWCAYLKAHYPLEFAAASLRHVKDEDQGIKLLRELVEEGFTYKPVDPERSGMNWSVVNGALVGGLTNIKGLGPSKAADVLARRAAGKPLTPGLAKLLHNPHTPYDDPFEGKRRFGDVYARPSTYLIRTNPVSFIRDVNEHGEYIVIAKLIEKNLRDLNEYGSVAKRGGRTIDVNNNFLNLTLEDDTGSIFATIGRYQYLLLGKPLVEEAKVGEWYAWKGTIKNNWRKLYISQWRKLGGIFESSEDVGYGRSV